MGQKEGFKSPPSLELRLLDFDELRSCRAVMSEGLASSAFSLWENLLAFGCGEETHRRNGVTLSGLKEHPSVRVIAQAPLTQRCWDCIRRKKSCPELSHPCCLDALSPIWTCTLRRNRRGTKLCHQIDGPTISICTPQ